MLVETFHSNNLFMFIFLFYLCVKTLLVIDSDQFTLESDQIE